MGLENYLCIGSTLTFFPLETTVVWGAGLINNEPGWDLISKPRKILAVRGPLTRQWLLDRGIECPAVYGDPALLLPRFYTPAPRSRARIGVIPNYADHERNAPALKRIAAWSEARKIAVNGYGDWRDVIDDITSCDMIVSSSLHGLIVAEAYQIPAIWVEFEPPSPGWWRFKFDDFYASIGKEGMEPFCVTSLTSPEEIWARRSLWTPARINLEPLLATCPFQLLSFA
ncbi:MAG: hypothetical protein GX803_02780 [Lentisphaerae bacterium]|jgi:pyruvyltransferase|nr:hypothetical protein [Lentisphaerota bacterium]